MEQYSTEQSIEPEAPPKKPNVAYRLLDYQTISFLYGIGSLGCLFSSSLISWNALKQRFAIEELNSADAMWPDQLHEYITTKYKQQLMSIDQSQVIAIPGKYLVKGQVQENLSLMQNQTQNQKQSFQLFRKKQKIKNNPAQDSTDSYLLSIDKKSKLVYSQIKISKAFLRTTGTPGQNVVEKRVEVIDKASVNSFQLTKPMEIQQGKAWSILKRRRLDDQKNNEFSEINGQMEFSNQINNNLTEFGSQFSKCIVNEFSTINTQLDSSLHQVSYIERFNDSIKAYSMISSGTMVVIGFSQDQVGIQLSDQVLVYGQVLLDLQRDILLFHMPEVIAKRKNQIVSLFSRNLNVKVLAGVILFSVGVIYAFKSAAAYLKHRKIMARITAPSFE